MSKELTCATKVSTLPKDKVVEKDTELHVDPSTQNSGNCMDLTF